MKKLTEKNNGEVDEEKHNEKVNGEKIMRKLTGKKIMKKMKKMANNKVIDSARISPRKAIS